MSGGDLGYTPGSWSKGGAALTEAASGFQAAASGVLAGITPEALGCTKGGTIADMAFAVVVPTLQGALQETVDGICAGLAAEGGGMEAAEQAFAAVEQANAEIAEGSV